MILLLNRTIPVKMARTFWASGILKLAGVKSIDLEGLENVDMSQTYVVAANHQSYLDIPLLFKVVPFNLYFVAKHQLKSVPFLGWYMMATGMFFIDGRNGRKAIESLNAVSKRISEGKSIFIFPEGTRSKTKDMGHFKKGAFIVAEKSKVDILPIKISGTGKIWNVKHGNLKPGKVRVQIMKSLPTNSIKNLALETERVIANA